MVVSAGLGAVAADHPYHKSSTKSYNGCDYFGEHDAVQVVSGDWVAGAGTSNEGGCAEVSVKLRVDGLDWYDWDASYAWANVQPAGWLMWSDHNANPLGPAGWIGFKMY